MTLKIKWVQRCSENGCGKALRETNKSGYCNIHNARRVSRIYHEKNKETISKKRSEYYFRKKLEKINLNQN